MSNYEALVSKNSFLRVIAPAKINLHLQILGLRKDGYHELAMVMQSIDLVDQLDMTSRNDGLIRLTSDSSELSTDSDNLIVKAAQLLQTKSGLSQTGADIYLQKRIPIGAGLAGGSSDGAAALVGLNSLWEVGYSERQLEELAAELGSDMPFCIAGGTQLCFGRGELLEPLPSSTTAMGVLLVKDPLVSVSTPWAYRKYKEVNSGKYLKTENEFENRRQSVRTESWLSPLCISNPPPLINDLQGVVASVTPAVQNALKVLLELPGAFSVAMSGSGPSCFALFSDLDRAKVALEENRINFHSAGLEVWCCSLRAEGVTIDQ